MHITDPTRVAPVASAHGETVYELLGRAAGARHSVAYVTIPPGKASLRHYHPEAEESYYILQGEARMLLGEEEASLSAGQIVYVPPLQPHRIVSTGTADLVFLAICAPAWEPGNSVFLEGQ